MTQPPARTRHPWAPHCAAQAALLVALLAPGCAPVPDTLAEVPRETEPILVESPPLEGWTPPASSLHPTSAPADPHGAGAAQHLGANLVPHQPSAPRGDATWTTPDGWRETPPATSMRLAQWEFGGDEEARPVECALFHFPGGGGNLEDNIARWIGQFDQPDGSPSGEHARRIQMSVDGIDTTLVQVSGTYTTQDPPMTGPTVRLENQALFAAIFDVSPALYFVKCTGPRSIVGSNGPALSEFVSSFRFGGREGSVGREAP